MEPNFCSLYSGFLTPNYYIQLTTLGVENNICFLCLFRILRLAQNKWSVRAHVSNISFALQLQLIVLDTNSTSETVLIGLLEWFVRAAFICMVLHCLNSSKGARLVAYD